jgi:hypothetical protein
LLPALRRTKPLRPSAPTRGPRAAGASVGLESLVLRTRPPGVGDLAGCTCHLRARAAVLRGEQVSVPAARCSAECPERRDRRRPAMTRGPTLSEVARNVNALLALPFRIPMIPMGTPNSSRLGGSRPPAQDVAVDGQPSRVRRREAVRDRRAPPRCRFQARRTSSQTSAFGKPTQAARNASWAMLERPPESAAKSCSSSVGSSQSTISRPAARNAARYSHCG